MSPTPTDILTEMLRLTREARRPRPTLYVVTTLTPDGTLYQMGTIVMGPEKFASDMAGMGIEVLHEGGSSSERSAVLRRHGSEAHAGIDTRITFTTPYTPPETR